MVAFNQRAFTICCSGFSDGGTIPPKLIVLVNLLVLVRLIVLGRLIVLVNLLVLVRLIVLDRLIILVNLLVLGRLVVVGSGQPKGLRLVKVYLLFRV